MPLHRLLRQRGVVEEVEVYAVEGRAAGQVGGLGESAHGQGAAHAESNDPHFRGALVFEVGRRHADLLDGLREVEVGHEVVRLLGVHSLLALVDIRDQHAVFPQLRELLRRGLDLVREPPPLLDDDDGRSSLGPAHEGGELLVAAESDGRQEGRRGRAHCHHHEGSRLSERRHLG